MTTKIPFKTPYHDEIAEICNAIEFARICGAACSGVLIDVSTDPNVQIVLLVVYVDLANRTLKDDCNMPVFPMFANDAVAREMQSRGLYDITGQNVQSGITRWWVKFSPTFI